MMDKTQIKIFFLITVFLLLAGVLICIFAPVIGVLYYVILILVTTILWSRKDGKVHRIMDLSIGGFFRGTRRKISRMNESGVEAYDNSFNVEYELVYSWNGTETHVPITKEEFSIGRSPTCDLVISGDQSVSRNHCRILYRRYSHEYYIEDQHSTMGTYLETKRLEPITQMKLMENSVILIAGKEYQFRRIGRQ